MTNDAGRRFEQAIAGISREVEAICTVVALCERVSRLSSLLIAAGMRASTGRQYSTQSLRVPLTELVERGLVRLTIDELRSLLDG